MNVFEMAIVGLAALVGLLAAAAVTFAAVRRTPSASGDAAMSGERAVEAAFSTRFHGMSRRVARSQASADVAKLMAELQAARQVIGDRETTVRFQQSEIDRMGSELSAEYARRKSTTRDLERAQAQVQVLLRKKRFYVDRSSVRTTQPV